MNITAYEELVDEIKSDLAIELELEKYDKQSWKMLDSKVRNAVREFDSRIVPDSFTAKDSFKLLEKHYARIRGLALFDYNQIGVEGQSAHYENGTQRTYVDRESFFTGIFAYCSTF